MRALILSDIHGNLEALQAVLTAAPPHDQLWNLGDVVGYGASPNQVIDAMRQLVGSNVRGNHDKVCCGLTPTAGFNPVAREAAAWTRNELSADATKWLLDLPKGPLQPPSSNSIIAHGSPADEDHYILSIRDAWEPLHSTPHRTTFFGHTHVQGGFQVCGTEWLRIHPLQKSSNPKESNRSSQWTLALNPEGTRYLLNPGSVGQPRDGDWRAAFALLDDDANQVTFYRQPYDIALAQGRILMAGLPDRLAQRLREGR